VHSTPWPRRLLLHVALALLATPVPGTVVLVTRASANRRFGVALLALLAGGGLTATATVILVRAPLSLAWAACAGLGLWLAAGLVLFAIERRARLAPEIELGSADVGRRLLVWPLVALVGWIPVAFLMVNFATHWGVSVFFKPSLPVHTLMAGLSWLVPIGVAIALVRAGLRRPFTTAAPLAFAAALPTLLLIEIIATALRMWLMREVFLLQWQVEAVGASASYGRYLSIGLWILALQFVALATYLSDARGIRSFGRHALATLGVTIGFIVNEGLIDSSIVVQMRYSRAVAAAARGQDEIASGYWAWIARRAPRATFGDRVVELGVGSSLRAGRPDRARALLDSTTALLEESSLSDLARQLPSLSEQEIASGSPHRLEVAAIQPEPYLTDSWCAALTAAGAAYPEKTESELKQALQVLSLSHEDLELDPLDGFDDLRVMARALGGEALAAPVDALPTILEAGHPALMRDPARRRWLLITALHSTQVFELLDYHLWDRERERPYEPGDATRFATGEDPNDEHRRRLAVESRRLATRGELEARLGLDGTWLGVIVSAGDAAEMAQRLGLEERHGDELVRLWQARHALSEAAPRRAARLAGSMAMGRPRSEIELLSRSRLARGDHLEPAAAAESTVTVSDVETASPWGVLELCTLGQTTDLPCTVRDRLLDRLHEIAPSSTEIGLAILKRRLTQGRIDEATSIANRLAREARMDPQTIADMLFVLATLAADDVTVQASVAWMLARLPPFSASEHGWPWTLESLPAYFAGRAALAPSPVQSVPLWRKAVRLAPTRDELHRALAAALEADGDSDAAAASRRTADRLRGTDACEVVLPPCNGVMLGEHAW